MTQPNFYKLNIGEKSMKEDVFKAIIGVLGGVATWLFGGCDALMIVLGVFMAVDYLTGTINAAISKTLNSSTGFVGLLRKGAMLLVVIVAAQLDKLLGESVFRSITCMFYIANEGISILENCAEIGIPLPKPLVDALKKLTGNDGTVAKQMKK